MKKINIANFVIYDLANRFNGNFQPEMDREIVDMVAEHWCKKHFVSASHPPKQHHHEQINQDFII